jgi:hypothetical protein
VRGERVRDAIRADLRGIVDPQAYPRLHAGTDDERGAIEVALREPSKGRRQWRHHRAEHQGINVVE